VPCRDPLAGARAYAEALAQEHAQYLAWANAQMCWGCGKLARDRPRDENGVALDLWATEMECMACFERRTGPKPEEKYASDQQKALYEAALAKLTPEERRILGL
jgi:hypothetical protein